LFIPLAVGGGIRSLEDARALVDAGADKVSINSAAIRRPALIGEIAGAFGSQAVIVAIDARRVDGRHEVLGRSGTTVELSDAISWAREAANRGAGDLLVTSIDRDGTRAGFDCDLTAAVSDAVSIPVIASGGAGLEAPGRVHPRPRRRALAASVFHFASTACAPQEFLAGRGIMQLVGGHR
jgi:cyclase